MQKKYRHTFAESDGFNTQSHFNWLIRWADPIGWALLVIAAMCFAGRVLA